MTKEIAGKDASPLVALKPATVGADPLRPVPPKLALLDRHRAARVQALRRDIAAFPYESDNPPILEVGCGHGHFLSSFATAHPGSNFWGIDFCRDRIRRAVRKQQRLAVSNLHFLHAEVGEFLEALPPLVQFSGVFVLFPDPWPKRRHKKNRLVSEGFLIRVARLLPAGNCLFFRSDSEEYFEEVVVLLEESRDWSIERAVQWDFDCATVFQEKAQNYRSLCAIRLS